MVDSVLYLQHRSPAWLAVSDVISIMVYLEQKRRQTVAWHCTVLRTLLVALYHCHPLHTIAVYMWLAAKHAIAAKGCGRLMVIVVEGCNLIPSEVNGKEALEWLHCTLSAPFPFRNCQGRLPSHCHFVPVTLTQFHSHFLLISDCSGFGRWC